MVDKERLEEHTHVAVKIGEYKDLKEQAEKFKKMKIEFAGDIDFKRREVLGLTERVQELEGDYEYLSHHYGLKTEQNKRYRDLFGRLLNSEIDDAEEYAYLAEQTAWEALEGESE